MQAVIDDRQGWEVVTETDSERTDRLRQPGIGWLYRTTVRDYVIDAIATSLVLVPERQ